MGMLLPTIVLLLLAVATSSAVHQALLLDSVQRFNGTGVLHHELKEVIRISIELVNGRVSADLDLQRVLVAANNGTTFVDLLAAATEALPVLRSHADTDPITVILARRFLLACIVLRFMNGTVEPLNADEEQRLAGLTTELYGLHVDGAVRKGLIDHLHISKSGGTSFSAAAKLCRCRKPPGIGQPLYLGDLPHWLNRTVFKELTGGIHMTWSTFGHVERSGEVHGCGERLQRIRAQGFQYVSNEYTLHGGLVGMQHTHLCPQGVNVVTLRHPDDRLVSHLHFLLAHMKGRIKRHVKGQAGEQLFQTTFCTSNVSVWEAVAPPILDNYLVRSFLGEHGFHTPLGGIGPEQLATALRLLLQFDLVLDLGAGDEATNTIMRQGLGWNITLGEVHKRSAENVSDRLKYDRDECRNEALLAQVLPRQEPDRQLYRMGRVLSFLDHLLVAWAQQLGLQPGTSGAGGSGPGDLDQCGLVGGGQHPDDHGPKR